MRVEDLKKGFGYKKDSVYRLITFMDEEFSKRLMQIEKDNKKHISELEEEIKSLREKNSALNNDLRLLASTINNIESNPAEE